MQRNGGRYCIVPQCTGRDSDEISMFAFPDGQVEAWCRALHIRPEVLRSNSRICSRHFHPSYIGKRKLKAGAEPARVPEHCDSVVVRKERRNLRMRRCHVESCSSTQPPNQLYRFPQDMKRRSEWIKVCVVKESDQLLKHLYICGKHFSEDMFTKGKYTIQKNAFPIYHLPPIQTNALHEDDEPLECRNLCEDCNKFCRISNDYRNKYLELRKEMQTLKDHYEESLRVLELQLKAKEKKIKEYKTKLNVNLEDAIQILSDCSNETGIFGS